MHPKSCRLGFDRCTHAGCADAKRVHLHLKTCPAGHDFPCPTGYEGCLQARKLLAHYRRCRNIRARQVTSPSHKGQHVCLICSMVARQARSLLDSNMQTPKPVVAHKKSSTNSKCQIMSSFAGKTGRVAAAQPQRLECGSGPKKILASFTLSADSKSAKFLPLSSESGPAGEWEMPPPAPRPQLSKSAPASPLGNCDRQELKGASGTLKAMPLLRRRSGSLGCDPGRRAVSFAATPEFFDRPECDSNNLVTVEIGESGQDLTTSKGRRGRSASCHLLTSSSSPTETCGTIYEEIGPATSCMDE